MSNISALERTSGDTLNLSTALKTGRLRDFIAQEEGRGITSDAIRFDQVVAAAVKPPRSEGQTSRSPSADGSTGT